MGMSAAVWMELDALGNSLARRSLRAMVGDVDELRWAARKNCQTNGEVPQDTLSEEALSTSVGVEMELQDHP